MIEGKENPTRNGMCLRLPNFIKVLEGFKCLYDIYTAVKSKSEEIVQAVSEVLVRKSFVEKAIADCEGCQDGYLEGEEEHWDGCQNSWEEIIRRNFHLLSTLNTLHNRAREAYEKIIIERGMPRLMFTAMFEEYTINNEDEISRDIVTPLDKDTKSLRQLYTLVYTFCELTMKEREICENRD